MNNPIKYNHKDPNLRVASLEAVSSYLRHYWNIIGAPEFDGAMSLMKNRTLVLVEDNGKKTEIDLGDPHSFELAWQGLQHAIQGAHRNQTRRYSQRQKRAETKARVGELEAQLRGLK